MRYIEKLHDYEVLLSKIFKIELDDERKMIEMFKWQQGVSKLMKNWWSYDCVLRLNKQKINMQKLAE